RLRFFLLAESFRREVSFHPLREEGTARGESDATRDELGLGAFPYPLVSFGSGGVQTLGFFFAGIGHTTLRSWFCVQLFSRGVLLRRLRFRTLPVRPAVAVCAHAQLPPPWQITSGTVPSWCLTLECP